MGLESGSAGAALVGIVSCLAGGVMNSTWPLFTKPHMPKIFRATSPGGWEWGHVWLVFTLVFVVLNIVYCIAAVGLSTLSDVYSSASGLDLAMVCTFSFLWGSGTMFYSIGIELLGAGLGICLVMSLLVVIGTILPLVEDHSDSAGSPAAVVTIFGLLLAIGGFACAAYSSKLRDEGLAGAQDKAVKGSANGDSTAHPTAHPSARPDPETSPAAAPPLEASRSDSLETGVGAPGSGEGAPQCEGAGGAAAATPAHTPVVTSPESCAGPPQSVEGDRGAWAGAGAGWGGGGVGEEGGAAAVEVAAADVSVGGVGKKVGGPSYFLGVVVCVSGAVMSSMLQFAFVYGDSLVDYAEEEAGVPATLAPLVIWLLAFSLSGVWNVVYACYRVQKGGTWGRFAATTPREWGQKIAQVIAMSVCFVGHIHLYGTSQELFGDLGTVIAWPLLMSSTVLSGQVWSVALNEWHGASWNAKAMNALCISLLIIAVTVIAVAGSVL